MRHTRTFRHMLWVAVLTATAVQAAPTTDVSALPDSTSGLSKAPGSTPGLRAADMNRDARTIDLLVEMQQPTAGIQFNERAARRGAEDGITRPAAALPAQAPMRAQVDAPPTPPSGLFGSGATPAVQARSVAMPAPAHPAELPGRGSPRPASEASPELRRWLAWPRQLIEYIRENRVWVAGTTATLLLLGWTASVMFNRHRG